MTDVLIREKKRELQVTDTGKKAETGILLSQNREHQEQTELEVKEGLILSRVSRRRLDSFADGFISDF